VNPIRRHILNSLIPQILKSLIPQIAAIPLLVIGRPIERSDHVPIEPVIGLDLMRGQMPAVGRKRSGNRSVPRP
jgi:hypothetical protein